MWGPGCLGLPAPWGSGSMANGAASGWAGAHGTEPDGSLPGLKWDLAPLGSQVSLKQAT